MSRHSVIVMYICGCDFLHAVSVEDIRGLNPTEIVLAGITMRKAAIKSSMLSRESSTSCGQDRKPTDYIDYPNMIRDDPIGRSCGGLRHLAKLRLFTTQLL